MDKVVDLLNLRNSRCVQCELSRSCKTVCLMGEGNKDAEVFLIGEAPGENEDLVGTPFVGEAGKLLTNILREYGFGRQDVYISNAVKCRPPANRTPKANEIEACRQYLIEELKIVQPKYIVALGAVAMRSLLRIKGNYKVGSGRGAIYYIPKSKSLKHIPIIPTYHPASIKRNQENLPPMLQDFEKLVTVMREGIKPPGSTEYFLGYAQADKHLVIDIETVGLDMFIEKKRILCIGTSVKDKEGFCSGQDLQNEQFLDDLSNPRVLKIGHNYKFDYKWLVKKGYVHRGPIFDTMIAAHIINENRPAYGLKELLLTYSDMGLYSAKIERILKLVKNDMRRVPKKILYDYNAKDADGTHRLYTIFSEEIKEQGLENLFKLVMKGEKVIANAELHGINVDQQYWARLSTHYEGKIDKYIQEIQDTVGISTFNPNSVRQLAKVLVEDLGLPILKLTPKKQVAIDKMVLDRLEPLDKSGLVSLILKLRKIKGDYAKYLNMSDPIFKEDGKIHAEYRINGADTGRYSCKDPNLMGITKDSPIRRIVIPTYKDGSIMQVDYDQGELRILAHQSKDKKLMEAFKAGVDIHKATASAVFGIPLEQVDDKKRFAAKTINFGIMYGIGAKKLGASLGWQVQDAVRFIKEYKARYAGVRQYIEDREKEIIEVGEVVSLFGRRRRITISDLDDIPQVMSAQRKAVNAPIQGGLHDLNVLSMVEVDRQMRKQGSRSAILMSIHDAVVFDVYPGEEEDLKKIIQEVFCNPDTSAFGFTFDVPLTVSITSGPNWKDVT